jgi:hypothetical protein
MRVSLLIGAVALLAGSSPAAEEDIAGLLKKLQAAVEPGGSAKTARMAWDQLITRGPGAVPHILQAMDTPNTALANWLRTAFDHIVEAELKSGGKKLDPDALLAFARDPTHQGRTRRLSLELVDRLRPGASDRLIPGLLDDPEFGYDAVVLLEKEAEALEKTGAKDKATVLLRKAFASSRDLPQVKTLGNQLRNLGVTVSVGDHMGFLTQWYLIGPFDGMGQKGFKTSYPPEKHVDLAAELDGKAGKVRWKRVQVREPAPAGVHQAGLLVNLREHLGNVVDAVAYAYTAFQAPAEQTVEFRGAADDNLTVFVNGERVFGFEEYRNGVRLDRHRFKVKLKAGVNHVLVKVCQTAYDPGNWEFLLRIVDQTGKGVAFPCALPEKK